jgi:glycosyltransferase involved in cell wall biosynthesis
MNIWFENANLSSNSGPNSFAQKLTNALGRRGVLVNQNTYDVSLCFIESYRKDIHSLPTVQRLDGIYFNTAQNYDLLNSNIFRTYKQSDAVVFQTDFNQRLITSWFGPHKNSTVIRNGADLELINSVTPSNDELLEQYDNIWCCAASWRPHKRLRDNIRYFLEHSGPKDVLFIAGDKQKEKLPDDSKVKYLGVLSTQQLISLYKTSTYFVHLAWLDHCPNVVVDARAAGCKVICTNSGGTKEIAGPDAIIIEQEEWDYEPVELWSPPPLDFSKKTVNTYDSEYDMEIIASKYYNFLQKVI